MKFFTKEKLHRYKIKYFSKGFLKKFLWSFVRAVIIFGLCYVILFPFFEKGVNSLKTYEDIINPTVRFIPTEITLDNIQRTMIRMNYYEALANTAWMSLAVAIIQTVISAIVGYGFAKFKFAGNGILFSFVILMLIIPPQTIIVPLFINFRFFLGTDINLIDTPLPQIILAFTSMGFKNGLYIFMFRQFFRNVPKELNEAAGIDGCGVYKTFVKIMLPSSNAMLVTIFLLSFSWQWTDTLYSRLFFRDRVVLSNVISTVGTGELALMAGNMTNIAALLAVIPLAIIYIFAQKSFVESVDRSGLVG